jgi:hypothetical protein
MKNGKEDRKEEKISQVWWYMTIIPALSRAEARGSGSA